MWKIDGQLTGRGVATEAVEAATRWFDESGTSQRTVCMIDALNTPSLAIATRFGFHPFREMMFRNNPVRLFERVREIGRQGETLNRFQNVLKPVQGLGRSRFEARVGHVNSWSLSCVSFF